MKKTVALVGIAVISWVLLLNGAHAASDKVELRFRFEEGKSYKLLVTVEQNIVMWIEGEEQEINQTIGIGETFNVKKVDADGTATIEVTFGSMSMKMDGPTGQFDYDSEDPPEEIPLPARGFAAMVGQGFTMKMTPDGQVKELSGVGEMLEKIVESLELSEGPMKDMIVEGIKNHFGDKALKEMMEQMLGGFPGKPVGIGDSWSQELTLTMGFPMTIENTCTLIDRKDGVATIKVESTIKPNKDAPPMKIGPMTMKYDLKGTQKGTFKLDEATGWFVGGEMKQKMSGEMTMKGVADQDEEVSLPMLIDSVIKFEPK